MQLRWAVDCVLCAAPHAVAEGLLVKAVQLSVALAMCQKAVIPFCLSYVEGISC